ncbi:GNAT family N-acetyltransferase [Symbiopectobacterium purcellii]|nr:GNAT family N-acetyltransferase [Symbiopectobacterium purcellii]
MKIISVRETPHWAAEATAYFQEQWASEETMMLYQDAIERSLTAANPRPQWYLLVEDERIVGCAGLITNDFISRMELYPWLCALYVEPDCRSRGLARQLIRHAADEARKHGFTHLHLCTDLVGFYEQAGFVYAGEGYHPWGESSRVYSFAL